MNTNPFGRECVPDCTIPMKTLASEFLRYHELEWRTVQCIRKTFENYEEFDPGATTTDLSKKKLYQFLHDYLIDRYERKYCNRQVTTFRRVVKWGTLLDYVSSAQSYELSLVPLLTEVDKRCRVNPKRTAVPREHIEAVLPFLSPMYATILWIQYRLGLRPSEACTLRSCDIDFDWKNGTWLYAPKDHKTAGRGKEKPSIIDKELQEVLKMYLPDDRNSDQPIFRNRKGNPVNPNEYGRKLKRTIDKNGLEKFVLYQARHTACTEVSAEFGRDYARAFMGHTSEKMTEHYDANRFNKDDLDKLQKIADSRNAESSNETTDPDTPISFPVEVPENRPKLRIVRGA